MDLDQKHIELVYAILEYGPVRVDYVREICLRHGIRRRELRAIIKEHGISFKDHGYRFYECARAERRRMNREQRQKSSQDSQ